jgi:hypothetical protein
MTGDDDDDEREGTTSGEVDVTGWARTDEETQRRRNKRKRITLDVFGPPLELPAPSAPVRTRHDAILPIAEEGSTELSLPDLRDLPRFGSKPPSQELAKVEDAWSRARDVPEAVPARPRNETPSAFPPPVTAAPNVNVNDAIDLVSRRSRPPGSSVLDLAGEMLDRFALGDFSGALLAAEIVLGKDPKHAEAQRCAASCRDRLSDMHLSRLGGANKIPQIAIAGSEVRWLGLDHRAGFLLSRVDGRSTIDELVDLSGMARHEALKILVELVDGGALSLTGR